MRTFMPGYEERIALGLEEPRVATGPRKRKRRNDRALDVVEAMERRHRSGALLEDDNEDWMNDDSEEA